MQIVAIIPARGGSKGIPRKNIRLLNGKPLIAYAIERARQSPHITAVFVSTDSREIADVAQRYGAFVIERDSALADDLVTLDPVIWQATEAVEQQLGHGFDAVITLQPTSPLLTQETLDQAIEFFLAQDIDTLISAVNRPHLSWGKDEAGNLRPLYDKRKNRQELPPHYVETGAFLITRRGCIRPDTRIGGKVSVYEVPIEESVDIDGSEDWILADSLLRRKRILFRVDGYIEMGLGHIYNCLTLAFSLIGHDVLLLTHEAADIGIQKIKETNLPYRTFRDEAEISEIIDEFQPDVWVNDCLNTSAAYIRKLKALVPRVVTIEDLGSGSEEADAVINALYDEAEPRRNVYSGYPYVCLRDEFQMEEPKPFSPEVKNIVVFFGGTDPSNLNRLVYDGILAQSERFSAVTFNFITGIGYDYEKNGVVNRPDKHINVYPNVPRVTKYLKRADLVVMGQGRSIFEVAAMGVPAVVMSQNEREMTHSFAQMEHGFLNLGLGHEVDPFLITNTLDWLIHTETVRENMRRLMLKVPLKSGLERVKRIILGDDDLDFPHRTQ